MTIAVDLGRKATKQTNITLQGSCWDGPEPFCEKTINAGPHIQAIKTPLDFL